MRYLHSIHYSPNSVPPKWTYHSLRIRDFDFMLDSPEKICDFQGFGLIRYRVVDSDYLGLEGERVKLAEV